MSMWIEKELSEKNVYKKTNKRERLIYINK